MAKTLKDFLEIYKPKAADEQKFVDKHVVSKHADRNGNGDDVFAAAKVKKVDRKKEAHGHEPGEDEKVYEGVEQVDEKINLAKAKMGDVVKDFYKSKAPQFAGKSKEKRRQMAVAAKLETEREMKKEGFDPEPSEIAAHLIDKHGKGKVTKTHIDAYEKDRDSNKAIDKEAVMKHVKKMSEEVESIEEKAGYSAKAAAAGKDIGKKGKQFSKIAASAAKKYGSKAAGERVAGAVLKKLRAEEKIEDLLSSLNESNKTLMLSVFGKLTEENQEKFVEAIEKGGLDTMLDFAIKNRNLE